NLNRSRGVIMRPTKIRRGAGGGLSGGARPERARARAKKKMKRTRAAPPVFRGLKGVRGGPARYPLPSRALGSVCLLHRPWPDSASFPLQSRVRAAIGKNVRDLTLQQRHCA